MNTQRVLLTWGGGWLLVSMCAGLYLGPQVHATRVEKEKHFEQALEHLVAQKPEMARAELRSGLKLAGDSGDRAALHSHVACMSFLALLIGLIQPFLGLSSRWKQVIVWAIVAGSVLHASGVLIEHSFLTLGTALAATGAPLLILGVIISFVGVVRFVQPKRTIQS